MEVERLNVTEPTPEDLVVLEKLRVVVQEALADGKISQAEMARLRGVLYSNGKVTPAELALIKQVVRECLGDAKLEYDWC